MSFQTAMQTETIFDGYLCEICGQFHAGQYISLACDCPDPYTCLTENEKSRAYLGTDDCVIDDEHYVRGIIELPIVGLDVPFLWGVWGRVWKKDYDEFLEYYAFQGREQIIGPYKSRLCNRLPGYDLRTSNLKCTIKIQSLGKRPLFLIEEPEHPLAVEQRNGISLQRARTISALVRHKL
jgi:hypothetical protein